MKTKAASQSKTARRPRLIALICLGLCLTLLLGACQGVSFNMDVPWLTNTPQPSKTSAFPQTPEPPQSETPETPPSTEAALSPLIVWVPPLFDPESSLPSARLLKTRLDDFAREQGIEIIVRVKSSSGPGSLLDALHAARVAAPAVSPDLIALPKADLDRAAQQGLIYSSEALSGLLDQADWYAFARQAASWNGSVFGVPFMSDPYAMVHDGNSQLTPVGDWTAIKENFGFFGFAADDPQGIFLLTLYLEAGGKVEDPQGRPMLETEPLTLALQLLKDANASRHMSNLVTGFQTSTQVWTAFLDWKLNTAFVLVSDVLAYTPGRVDQPLPELIAPDITVTSAWSWAVATPASARAELAVSLAEYLTEPEFLATWTEEMRDLPARSSALNLWTQAEKKPVLEQIAQAAVILPREDVLNIIGPVLRNATLLILRDNADPQQTALQAVESLP